MRPFLDLQGHVSALANTRTGLSAFHCFSFLAFS